MRKSCASFGPLNDCVNFKLFYEINTFSQEDLVYEWSSRIPRYCSGAGETGAHWHRVAFRRESLRFGQLVDVRTVDAARLRVQHQHTR